MAMTETKQNRRGPKRLVPNTKGSALVNELFDLFIENKAYKTTADILNRRGYKTKNDKVFTATSIRRHVSDSIYVGKYVRNKRGNGEDGRLYNKEKEEWITIDSPKIISDEKWKIAQKIVSEINKVHGSFKKRNTFLLSGILEHKGCGGRIYGHRQERAKPKYICRKCGFKTDLDPLEKAVIDCLENQVFKTELIREQFDKQQQKCGNEAEQATRSITTLKTNLSSLEGEFRALLRAYDKELVSDERFKNENSRIDIGKTGIAMELSGLEEKIRLSEGQEEHKKFVLEKAMSFAKILRGLAGDDRNLFLKKFIQNIEVTEESLILKMFFLPEYVESINSQEHIKVDPAMWVRQPFYSSDMPNVFAFDFVYTMPKIELSDRTFSERLKKLRIEKKLYQSQLAKLADVDEMTIVGWERNQRKPRPNQLERVAKALMASSRYLLVGEK